MIYNKHTISYQNVASKYYKFESADFDKAVIDFRDLLMKYGCQPTGQVFLSMLSDPRDESVLAEVFMGIEENDPLFPKEEEMRFRSYFHIKPMIVTRILSNVEEVAQVKYWDLMKYIHQYKLEQSTPVFIELKMNNKGDNYIEMSTGTRKAHSIFRAGEL